MRRIMIISAALPLLLAGALTASAQTQMPQEPRGEDSVQSASPSGQLKQTPTERREQESTQKSAPGTTGASPRGQSTPQEPRGEEGARSAYPRGEQPRN
jgi:hypothetical protein